MRFHVQIARRDSKLKKVKTVYIVDDNCSTYNSYEWVFFFFVYIIINRQRLELQTISTPWTNLDESIYIYCVIII